VSITFQRIQRFLESTKLTFEVMGCDPTLSDTAIFCKEYRIDLNDSVNTIIIKTKTGESKYVACALLASTRLDMNKTIKKKLETRKVSFADALETTKLTGMEIGGVTPIELPASLPLWIDSKIMTRSIIVLGGGNRSSKIKISPKIFNFTENTEIVDGLANKNINSIDPQN
tara:strand:+ start:1084 stop:1596 length:513 start_codon:yes stop_codon:yes gene_type:complete